MLDDTVTKSIHVCVPDNDLLVKGAVLGLDMAREAKTYAGMDFDLDTFVEFGYDMRADPFSFVNVAVCGDNVIGFFVGSIAHYGFHDSRFAYDRLLFVSPTVRGSVAARMLIRAFEKWATGMGASRILLGITTGVHTERTEKFYNKLGYDTVGVLTMKET